MQLFLALTKMEQGLEEDQQKTRVPVLLMTDHLLKVLIHPLQDSQDKEITVQDSMIN